MREKKIALGLTLIALTTLAIPLAFAVDPLVTYTLNVYSMALGTGSFPGVPFTINGVNQITPYSAALEAGSYTVVMPLTITIGDTTYNFVWWETGSTNPTRIVSLAQDTSIYAHYEVVPPPPPEAGYSPGYWKHQFTAFIDGKGKPQETWADLVTWTGMIDTRSRSLPTPWGLPPLAQIDYNGDGSFTTADAYGIFVDKAWKTVWIPLANWYNWAAGYGPYP